MARQLYISDNDGSKTANLLTGVLKMRVGSWSTSTASDGRIIESMQLVAIDTDANIRSAEQTIDDLAELARLWNAEKTRPNSVWFYWKSDTETAKRALVYSIELFQNVAAAITPLLGIGSAEYTLAIERHEYFENTTAAAITNLNQISSLGGKHTFTAIAGAVPARIESATLRSIAGGPTMSKFWAGIRPDISGTSAFNALWELENGTLGTGASLITDAAGSPSAGSNNVVSVSFGTATMANRVSIALSDIVGSNHDDFLGKYLVLLRARKTVSGDVIRARLKTGYSQSDNLAPAPIKKIQSDFYQFYEMGEIQIPPIAYRAGLTGSGILQNTTLQIEAERVSGTGNLRLDCLVLIPTDHFIKCEGAENSNYVRWRVMENDEQMAVGVATGDILNASLAYTFRNWECPVGVGSIVVAGERAAGSTVTDLIEISFYVYERHKIHRDT